MSGLTYTERMALRDLAHQGHEHAMRPRKPIATVDLYGLALTVGYEVEPAEDAEHYQFGTLPAQGEWLVPLAIIIGDTAYQICEVLAEPAIAAITSQLNGVTA